MQDEKYQDVIPVVREEYEEAYKNAKAIDEKPDATSEEVETAYKTLIEVGKRLTMYKGDLTELQAAYDLYAGKDLSIYTQDSKTVLEEALKEAEKVLKLGENAVKEDVNEALEKLQNAGRMDDLRICGNACGGRQILRQKEKAVSLTDRIKT